MKHLATQRLPASDRARRSRVASGRRVAGRRVVGGRWVVRGRRVVRGRWVAGGRRVAGCRGVVRRRGLSCRRVLSLCMNRCKNEGGNKQDNSESYHPEGLSGMRRRNEILQDWFSNMGYNSSSNWTFL